VYTLKSDPPPDYLPNGAAFRAFLFGYGAPARSEGKEKEKAKEKAKAKAVDQ